MKHLFTREQKKAYNIYVKTRTLGMEQSRVIKSYDDMTQAFNYSSLNFKKITFMALSDIDKAKKRAFHSSKAPNGVIISGKSYEGKNLIFAVSKIPGSIPRQDFKTYCLIQYGIVKNLSVTNLL